MDVVGQLTERTRERVNLVETVTAVIASGAPKRTRRQTFTKVILRQRR
jgi:hypothetical protein